MALTKTFSVAGAAVTDGYLRVSHLFGDKNQLGFVLAYQASPGQAALKLEQYDIQPNLEGGNFIQQAYEHLKTLPEFEGAEDC